MQQSAAASAATADARQDSPAQQIEADALAQTAEATQDVPVPPSEIADAAADGFGFRRIGV